MLFIKLDQYVTSTVWIEAWSNMRGGEGGREREREREVVCVFFASIQT
jgi:hypothetical protein